MYRLTDIALSNWYLIRREQIRIRGAAALVGPTGAGKSTIFDAVGTVLAGNNASRLALNAAASGRRDTVRSNISHSVSRSVTVSVESTI